MWTEHHILERRPDASSPQTDAVAKSAMMLDHVFQTNWAIIKVFPRLAEGNTYSQTATSKINLPACPALLAATQLHVSVAIDSIESFIKGRSFVVPDFNKVGEIAALAHGSV